MPNDRAYWYKYKGKPPLHICIEYNTTVYLRTRKGKPIPSSGGKDGSKT